MTRWRRWPTLAAACLAATLGAPALALTPTLTPFQPDVQRSGRAVAVTVKPGDPNTAIAGAETGGLFITHDAGLNWSHIETMANFRIADVRYSPDDPNMVVATAWQDDHRQPGPSELVDDWAGIWNSVDGGATWTRSVITNRSLCSLPLPAFGISFRQGTVIAYVATPCGMARSNDRGVSWMILTADPVINGVGFSSVVAHGAYVDACGPSGHARFSQAAGTWSMPSGGSPACDSYAPHAIDVSPYEDDVLFVAARASGGGTVLMESDDGGAGWTSHGAVGGSNARPPFVRVHESSFSDLGEVDVWFGTGAGGFGGGGALYYQFCNQTTGTRCRSSASNWTDVNAGHPDMTDLAYSAPGALHCPMFATSDGGIHAAGGCGVAWSYSGSGVHGYNALQIYEMEGQIRDPASALVIGTQDNGAYVSIDGGATWADADGCDIFNVETNRTFGSSADDLFVYKGCGPNQKNTFSLSGVTPWTDPPGTSLGMPRIVSTGTYFQMSMPAPPGSSPGLYKTMDAGMSWTPVTTIAQPLANGTIYMGGPPADPILYLVRTRPGGSRGLLRITGAMSGSVSVEPADTGLTDLAWLCQNNDGRDPLAVSPSDPLHLIASDKGAGSMMVSDDGGDSWLPDPELTTLVKGYGTRLFNAGGCSEVSSITFDRADPSRIYVGTDSAGLIVSVDGGTTWFGIPGSEAIPKITSVFPDERRDEILLSSYGRGIWKLSPRHALTAADADGDDIPDVVEDLRPGGRDGNGDGIDDSAQSRVASFPNAKDGRYVTLSVSAPGYFARVTPTDKAAPTSPPAWAAFPYGFFGFVIAGVAPGGKADVSFYAPGGAGVSTYYKYGHITAFVEDWYLFDYEASTSTGGEMPPSGPSIILHFVDGLRGDDDLTANGTIVDPGGSASRLEVGSLDWIDAHTLAWSPLAGASSYRIYEGSSRSLGDLLTISTDACVRATAQNSTTASGFINTPGPGRVLWYLVAGVDPYGESASGDATSGPRQLNSPGECGASCAHDKCVAGGALDPACDPCVAEVCAADPSCCGANGWGPNCPTKVLPVCRNVSCFPVGQCAHNLCKAGAALQPACDQGAITPSCVTKICQKDPLCCQQSWGTSCVDEVSTVCGLNCN